ncbi:uncharacterized protein LOC108735270 [Agrilus planipennis]|uniref:Uncharacterized protein LOC108735270 n=1 Tax=Agrilus planipennis TaxID=224129 RepID=A0A1W4WRA9_AGRPL|nr:uncharacterized protein LOC108735270 [Agrilus planipennis]
MSVCDEILEARSALKTRKVNVIHRTTSETIRLGEPDLFINNSTAKPCNVLPLRKKPVSSFQVTGISVTQRPEFGDDSADDLDESHTDDISRITDNETPSFSEESFSRDIEEVPIISPVVSLETTNVLPISPCYELAIVAAENFEITAVEVGDVQELSVICTDITDNSSEFDLASVLSKMTTTTTYAGQCVRIVGGRFKVVKIETAEPFKRGRWNCLDYLDQSIAINPHIIKTQHMSLIITDPIAYYSNANNNNATVTTGQHATEATFNSNFKTDQKGNETLYSSAIATTISSIPTNVVPSSILTETQQNRILTYGYIEGHLPVHGQTLPTIYYCNKSESNLVQPEIITTASTIVSASQNYRVSTKVAESLITKVCQSQTSQNYIQYKGQAGLNQNHGELLQKIDNFNTEVKEQSVSFNQTTGGQKNLFQSPPVTLPNYNLFNVPISYVTAVNHGQIYKEQSVLKSDAESVSFDIPSCDNNRPVQNYFPNFGISNLQFSRPQQHNLRSAYSLPTGMPSLSVASNIPASTYTLDSGVSFFVTVSNSPISTNTVGQPVTANSSSSTGASVTFHKSSTHVTYTNASTSSYSKDASNYTQSTSETHVLQTSIPSSMHSSSTLPCIHQLYQIQNSNQPQESSQIYSPSLTLTRIPSTGFQQNYQPIEKVQHTRQNTLNQINNSSVYSVSSAPVIQNIPTHQKCNIPMVQSQTYAAQNYTAKSEHHVSNDQNQFSRNYEAPFHSQPEIYYTINQPNVEINELYYNKAQKSPKIQHNQSPTTDKTILTEAPYQIEQTYVMKDETIDQYRPHDLSLRGSIQQKESPISSVPQEYRKSVNESSPQEFGSTFPNSPIYSPVNILERNPLYQSSPIQSPTVSINQPTSASASPLIYEEIQPQLRQTYEKEERIFTEPAANEFNSQNTFQQPVDSFTSYNESTLPNQLSQISGGTSLLAVIDEEEDVSLKEQYKTIKSEVSQLSSACGSKFGEASTNNLEDTQSATTLTPDDDNSRTNRLSSGNGLR